MRSSAKSDRIRAERDCGQAVVELALCLPVVMLMLLGVVQIAVIIHTQLLVQHAAREAVRAASVDADPSSAATHALADLNLHSVTIGVASSGDLVTVNVDVVTQTNVPLIGGLIPDIHQHAQATMTFEPP
jgi:Flp pilus assembly protein TadG